MSEIFIKLLNMSISAGWLVLCIIALRLILKKAPRWIMCLLWAMVAVRLVCPFSLESALSLIPSAETVPEEIIYSENPEIHTGIEYFNSTVNPIISEELAPSSESRVNPIEIIAKAASVVWGAGMAVMAVYAAVSYTKIRKRVGEAVEEERGVWICDRVDTPFILGLFRPRIILPSDMGDGDREYVIAHERAHISRRDHIWKPLGFFLLTVYWFNPLIWIAYILLCRDIEASCDEKVIKNLGEGAKKPYAEALINCSVQRRMISACPLAFGETGVKGRVKSVLSYKKPAFWIIIVAIVACIAAGVFFLTDPKTDDAEAIYLETGETVYANGMFSLVQPAFSYKIENKEVFFIFDEDTERWNKLGKLEKIELNEDNFLERFVYDDTFEDGYYPSKLLMENERAYEVKNENIKKNYLYILLYQKDGTIMLCEGYCNNVVGTLNERDNGDSSMIRWVHIMYSNADSEIAGPSNEAVESDDSVEIYLYHDSPEPLFSPQITLSKDDATFRFSFSALSSSYIAGTYELTETELILTTEAEEPDVYVFRVVDENTFAFVAEKSAKIPSYRYGEGEGPECPVPDGAEFVRKNITVSLNDWISMVPVITSVEHDINGDGTPEECTLSPGPTSGVNSIAIHVVDKKNDREYRDWWNCDLENASFSIEGEKLYICGEMRHSMVDYVCEYEIVSMSVNIENGELIIEKTENDSKIGGFLRIYNFEEKESEVSQDEIYTVCERMYEKLGRTDPDTGFDYYCVVDSSFEIKGEKYYFIDWKWLVEDEKGNPTHASQITQFAVSEDFSKVYEAYFEDDGILKIFSKRNIIE